SRRSATRCGPRIPDLATRNRKAETWWKPVIASEDKTGREAPISLKKPVAAAKCPFTRNNDSKTTIAANQNCWQTPLKDQYFRSIFASGVFQQNRPKGDLR